MVLLWVAVFIFPKMAVANLAARQLRNAMLGSLTALRPTNLRVVREVLTFDCRESGWKPVCAFKAVYHLHHPGRNVEHIVAAFYGLRSKNVRIFVRGKETQLSLLEKHIKALDRSVKRSLRKTSDSRYLSSQIRDLRDKQLQRIGFKLTAQPGERLLIEVTGMMHPQESIQPSYAISPVRTRHLLLGSEDLERRFYFSYLIAPIRTWQGTPSITLRVTYPRSWDVRQPFPKQGTRRRVEGQLVTIVAGLDATLLDIIPMEVRPPRQVIFNGGFLLGIGGDVTDAGGFRMRLGYEFAAPSWLLYSVQADTDFQQYLVLTAMVEAASPSMFLIPSFGFGVGVAAMLLPETTAGLRLQATIQWPILGFVTSIDLFPALGTRDPLFVAVNLMCQVGF